jgi:hypothetical protein
MLASRWSACAALALLLAVGLPAAADTDPAEPIEAETVDAQAGGVPAEVEAEAAEAAPMLDEPIATDVPPVPEDAALATEPDPFTGRLAREDWSERRPWRYGTQHLFPLTRGMDDAGVPSWGRWPLYLFTVPFDVAHAPLGAVAGLYGD